MKSSSPIADAILADAAGPTPSTADPDLRAIVALEQLHHRTSDDIGPFCDHCGLRVGHTRLGGWPCPTAVLVADLRAALGAQVEPEPLVEKCYLAMASEPHASHLFDVEDEAGCPLPPMRCPGAQVEPERPVMLVVEASPGAPPFFVDAVRSMVAAADDPTDLEGVHRFVYLDTSTGKRSTCFVRAGEGGSQIRSYVFFPYLLAKDLRTEATSDDPLGVLTGRVSLAAGAQVEGDGPCDFADAERVGSEATADYCYAHQDFCK